jgi:hypothetical protein
MHMQLTVTLDACTWQQTLVHKQAYPLAVGSLMTAHTCSACTSGGCCSCKGCRRAAEAAGVGVRFATNAGWFRCGGAGGTPAADGLALVKDRTVILQGNSAGMRAPHCNACDTVCDAGSSCSPMWLQQALHQQPTRARNRSLTLVVRLLHMLHCVALMHTPMDTDTPVGLFTTAGNGSSPLLSAAAPVCRTQSLGHT